MKNNGILYDMGGWAQFFFFFFLTFSGLIFGALIIVAFMTPEQMMESAPSIRLAQTIQTVFLFLVPALLFTILCQRNPQTYLRSNTHTSILLILLGTVLVICIQPVINCIGYYNQQIVLPESFNWMKEMEESAEKTLKIVFADKSIFSLIFNLLVIAVVAGLAEELFFRGVLQQILQQIVKNKHVAIWITAITFSAIHFQFYGFVPRVLLGALLGYLFVWSNNIWIPIIVHTIHNAVNVVLMHLFYDTPTITRLEDMSLPTNIIPVLTSTILSVLILFMIYRTAKTRVDSEK